MSDSTRADGTGPRIGTDFDPFADLLAHNRLTIAGWAVAPAGIDSVRVEIGGRGYTASFGLPSSEGHDEQGFPDAGHARFEISFDTSGWDRGRHGFEIAATDRGGAVATVSAVADVQPYDQPPFGDEAALAALAAGKPAMWCEAPALYLDEKAQVPVEISGWATAPAGIERVLVTLDGQRRIEVLHGMVRPDLRERLGDAVAADGGFALRLDPSECPPGWHEITVLAIDSEGQAVGSSGQVECVPSEPARTAPEGVIDPLTDLEDAAGMGRTLGDGRFVPRLHRRMAAAPEHFARYGWAAPLADGCTVLDAGCGSGWGTALLAEHATKAVGVDLSPLALEEAQRQHGAAAEFRQGDLHALPYGDGEFDMVVCFEAIEHVPEPERVLDELRRVLRPSGLLVVSSPNRGVYPEGNPLHLHELTASELRSALEKRFAKVAIYRQQTHVASLLAIDSTLELDDPAVPLTIDVAKLVGGPPGSELYTIGIATNGELPSQTERLVLGAKEDFLYVRWLAETWQERCAYAEAQAAAVRAEIEFVRRQQRATLTQARGSSDDAERRSELEAELAQRERELSSSRAAVSALQASASWRLTSPLRKLKRTFRR